METQTPPESMFKSVSTAVELCNKLGMLECIKSKLVKQPDIASTKLAAILEELQKTLNVFESEVVQFLSINLVNGPDSRKDRAILLGLEGDSLFVRTNAARGQCAKIGNLFDKYLNPWFQRVTDLSSDERGSLEDLFQELRHIDGILVSLLNEATGWLTGAARRVLELVEQGKLEEANSFIAKSRAEILPVRKAICETLSKLRSLEADFIEMSKSA